MCWWNLYGREGEIGPWRTGWCGGEMTQRKVDKKNIGCPTGISKYGNFGRRRRRKRKCFWAVCSTHLRNALRGWLRLALPENPSCATGSATRQFKENTDRGSSSRRHQHTTLSGTCSIFVRALGIACLCSTDTYHESTGRKTRKRAGRLPTSFTCRKPKDH